MGALGADSGEPSGPLDFFISYSPADERWAVWIAWTLEEAGYRTFLQAWDFVPGTNFVDFMDRGVTESAAVIALLSRHYERSRYGRLEWQAALRADPDAPERRLLTVRVEDVSVDGLLAMITYVDLVGVADHERARRLLLARVEQALEGHARPRLRPGFPGGSAPAVPGAPNAPGAPAAGGTHLVDGAPAPSPLARPIGLTGWSGRRRPSARPEYPPAAQERAGRGSVTVLQLAGPAFGRGQDPVDLQAAIWGDLVALSDAGAPAPELLVVTGDLTASGSPRECDQALAFLTGLRTLLGLEPHRVAIVPGGQDVSLAASRAYFSTCEADEQQPRPPYWPKWRHYTRLFQEFYQGLDTVFDSDQPWTLFPVPELGTVVAGLNSSLAYSHRPDDQYGWLGPEQAAWFAQALRPYESEGWLRIGALRHPLAVPARPPDTGAGAGHGSGHHPGALRDLDRFTRLTAPRLHLLLHGPADGRSGVGGLSSPAVSGLLPADEAAVARTAGPGSHQVLQLTADGLTRWPGPDGGARERLRRPWPRSRRAFGPGAGPDEPGGPGAGAAREAGEVREARETREAREVPSPLEALTARVAEVCRTRHQGAQLRSVGGPLPQLLVTWSEADFVRQQRVAVCLGTPRAEDIDGFIAQVHAAETAAPAGTGDAELVYEGPPPGRALREHARRRGVRLRSFVEFQGLLDLQDYVAAQSARLRSDDRYPPSLYLPQRYRRLDAPTPTSGDGLVDHLLGRLDGDQGRFVLLLGDFGHGKTFALRELARRIPLELPQLTPLFIELQALDRAHSFDELVAAHLAGHGIDTIDLRAFRYMLRQGRIVLLFDGFDELVNRVSYERAADHLRVLLDASVDSAKIVVSSRTQHFSSQQQVLTALGERVRQHPQRELLDIQEFTPAQIRSYLANRYGDEAAADRRLRLLQDVPDLLALCRNPRLLSFVAELAHDRLRSVASAGRALSAARLYEEVLTAWLEFEERRGRGGPGSVPGLSLDQLWAAVTELAVRLWESGRDTLPLEELTDLASTLAPLADGHQPAAHTAHAVGSGSLLVRTDDGMFEFIHSSVMEWLVAREAAVRLTTPTGDRRGGDRQTGGLLARARFSRLAVEFLCDLADHRVCQEWAEHVLAAPAQEPARAAGRLRLTRRPAPSDETARANALRILARLRVPSRTDLRGALLVGEDLSHRDLSGVDLSHADLTDARLVGTDLSGAVLRGARLVGARLSGANLSGADLSGADLRRARLIRTDLRGARVAGGHWQRAAVISAATDPDLLATPELRTAAVAPGLPVEPGLRPSEVGVPYGFDPRTSRLPEPVAFSTDGQLLAVGGDDGTVLICDALTGTALRTLRDHVGRVYAVKFAEDVLATGSADGTVRLWDPVSGACRHRLDVHPDGVWPVSLRRDSRLLATGDAEGTVTLWDTVSGRPLHHLPGHTAPVYTAVYSPDGTLLVTGDAGGDVRLWEVDTGRLVTALERHHGPVYRARFSPDGTLLATGDGGDPTGPGPTADPGPAVGGRHPTTGGTVRLWDTATWHLRRTLTGHTGRVYTLAFHPDEPLLASGDTSGQVRLWDTAGGAPGELLTGCAGAVYQVAFHTAPDGSGAGALLAAGDSAGTVRVWQLGGGHGAATGPDVAAAVPLRRQPQEHHGSVWACKFRPHGGPEGSDSGTLLVTGGNDGAVRLWDAATGQSRRLLRGHGRRIGALSFNASGNLLAAAGNDGTVRLWEPATGRRVREITGRSNRLVSAAFGPSGPVLATASNDGDMYLWNAASGEFQRRLDVETEHVWAEAFSPDATLLATANDDDTVRIWYRSTGAHVVTLAEHRGRVRSIDFGPDGRHLATACDDSRIRLWDLSTGRVHDTLEGHTDRVYAVVHAPDGSWLASASWDGLAVIWADGRPRHHLRGHTGRLWTAAVHPGGDRLATAGDDRVIRLWDPRTGRESDRLPGHTGRILTLAFSPDGSLLASGAEDGTIRLWTLPGSGSPAALHATLLATPTGWAALSPSGGYKYEGDLVGEFWHAVGMCRFEPGELDTHLPGVRRLPLEAPL
ncbi:TIR domain-containing protein [Streptomyces sp. SP17BM10]|uniref:WD40 domain-containing protein n=1 Tax=Streptomyces sp. SP17BM10 TaxID=3002530 RepID=UPI002E79F1F4|nr:TIR domain-containing protein [Streptomyces sp. SP17BM10]MEE1782186.1 TIR domain-containing protein [Streptomyces sp. SP17BM10]